MFKVALRYDIGYENSLMNCLADELFELIGLLYVLRFLKPNLLQNLYLNPVLAKKELEFSP